MYVTAIHKINRDGYRDQIVTHDVGVSLHSKTHPLFMKYSNGTSTVLCISLSELVSCAFSTIPICPFLIPRIFHLLVYIGSPCSYRRISSQQKERMRHDISGFNMAEKAPPRPPSSAYEAGAQLFRVVREEIPLSRRESEEIIARRLGEGPSSSSSFATPTPQPRPRTV